MTPDEFSKLPLEDRRQLLSEICQGESSQQQQSIPAPTSDFDDYLRTLVSNDYWNSSRLESGDD